MVIVWSCRERERREKERDEWEKHYGRQSHSPSPNAKHGEFICAVRASHLRIEILSYFYPHYERTESRLFLWIELGFFGSESFYRFYSVVTINTCKNLLMKKILIINLEPHRSRLQLIQKVC